MHIYFRDEIPLKARGFFFVSPYGKAHGIKQHDEETEEIEGGCKEDEAKRKRERRKPGKRRRGNGGCARERDYISRGIHEVEYRVGERTL